MLMDKAKQKHHSTRAPKTTRTQYGIIVDALEKNGQINWEKLTGRLNAASNGTGPRRTASGWRRVFSEWKCNVKKKARNFNDEGFPQLSTLELRLLKDQSIVEEQELSKIRENVRENVRETVKETVTQKVDQQKDVTKRAPKTKPKQYEIMLRALELDEMNWENLTKTLNCVAGGPVKTSEGWRRVFTEWKCNVKKRAKSKGDPNFLSQTDKQLLIAIGAHLDDSTADPFEPAFPSDSSMSSITDNIFKIKGEPFEEDISIEQNDFDPSAPADIISTDRNEIVEDFVNFEATNTLNDDLTLHLNNNNELMKKVDLINSNLEAINNTLIQLTGVLSKLVEKS